MSETLNARKDNRMKKTSFAVAALLIPIVSSWAVSVTVKQSGGGDYTNIQAAIDSGASTITIIDSAHYVENLEIGNPDTGGSAVTLTSNQTGDKRPVITPSDAKSYVEVNSATRFAGFGLFANNSVVANLILEAQPDFNNAAMMLMATNVLIENCLFRIPTNTLATLSFASPLLFVAQQGDPSSVPRAVPGGRDSNGSLVRNCEFIGVAPDANPLEPIGTGVDTNSVPDGTAGYLDEKATGKGTGQLGGYVRMEFYSDGRDVFVTFEGCYFHHCRDYGIFPSNRESGPGSLNVIIKKCRFDAQAKFQFRGRGANVYVESSVFTRANQARNGDDENSAVAIQTQDGHVPSGSVSNCVFVNCGSANAQRAYYGGVNNHNGNLLTVDHCTFVDCVSGVGAGRGGAGATLSVSNSIFHQIGDNVPPSVDSFGITLTNGSPELVGGLYPAWTNGLANFGSFPWSAVFNRFMNNNSQIIIDNCMVGSIDTEDTQPWDQALTNVIGCRLYAGYDTNFVGTGTVFRATPVFVNNDPNAPNAFQLASGSPGQGLGANVAPVLEPKLGTSVAGNQLTISWTQPIWMTGYALKITPSLSSPSWTTVPGVTNFSVNYSATVTVGDGNQYFAILKLP
ncbi:MAG: hypothetical protein HY298_21435 [Verrucomicrobia bacterium]|nr:hypothetical protein [Verrucomicrobiota bacterium]